MAKRMRASVELLGCVALALTAAACDRTQAAQPPQGQARAEADGAQARRVAELEGELVQLREELTAARASVPPSDEDLLAEIASLRTQLAELEERRVARELDWQRYMDTLRAFELPEMPSDFQADVPPEQGPPVPPPAPVDDTLVRRSAELARSLRALLAIEGVRGIDLFEAGTVHDEATGGWIGPVVFRTLDERGRLAGSLCAERLRLEGSRAARTLTIVLEDGYESRGGERLHFPLDEAAHNEFLPIGTRRFALTGVDPMPWFEAAPELFGQVTFDEPVDDGRWNVDYVRGELNRLMREDAAHGYWRIKSLGGIADGVLREVHLEGLDPEGRMERRAFADRLTVVEQDRGVMLLLEEGALERGDERAPFLDGRFRVFLPRADLQLWRAAGIPGLSPPPKKPAR